VLAVFVLAASAGAIIGTIMGAIVGTIILCWPRRR
jgi:tetrahydromethanopterin S-methyltransferase subunit C